MYNQHGGLMGEIRAFGRSQKEAIRKVNGVARKVAAGKVNIAAGYVDEDTGVFHPIRASFDYDPSRVGERRGAKRARGKKGKSKKRR